MTFITADGTRSTSLGRVNAIPIKFGEAIIPTDAIVTDANTYDIILGNEWLARANAVVDLNREAMTITWHG